MLATTAAAAHSTSDLRDLSIEELTQVKVTSVTKTAESVDTAPSAVYIITRDAILRSGYLTVPEILRLAPNLFVAEISPSRYVITARGLSGNDAAQNFNNKLLVLIDGRSVYTPIFSGVNWDQQDVRVEDIDRIEVISGAGSTLFGANAVNGVINIVTRSSALTQGLAATGSAGTQERSASVRYGGQVGERLSYRAYVQGYDATELRTAAGARAGDGLSRVQGGFRLDWAASAADAVTLQGDAYDGAVDQNGAPDAGISGRNLLTRWTHAGARSRFEVQAYYDHFAEGPTPSGLASNVDTYDLALQENLSLGAHALTFGGGARVIDLAIEVKPGNFFFVPPSQTEAIGNVFVQDSIMLTKALRVIVGVKAEHNYYSGLDLLPSARVAYTLGPHVFLWAAVSRAIRSPTPFDRDVVEIAAPPIVLRGNPNFLTERLVTYEGGARISIGKAASLSVSGFFNDYDKLRNIQTTPVTFFPLTWGNGLLAQTHGIDAWATLALAPWWSVGASFDWLKVDAHFAPGASRVLGTAQLGDDPEFRAGLSTDVALGAAVTARAALRYVDTLPDPRVPSYVELDTRLAWQVAPRLEIALVGRNLLHDRHVEYTSADPVQRSVLGQLRWRY